MPTAVKPSTPPRVPSTKLVSPKNSLHRNTQTNRSAQQHKRACAGTAVVCWRPRTRSNRPRRACTSTRQDCNKTWPCYDQECRQLCWHACLQKRPGSSPKMSGRMAQLVNKLPSRNSARTCTHTSNTLPSAHEQLLAIPAALHMLPHREGRRAAQGL
jgi:hypothetical protein